MKFSYPQYRKYKNNRSYFKIISPDEFEEIVVFKGKGRLHHFQARILPDRNLVSDMTFDFQDYWEAIDYKAYEYAMGLLE